MTSYFGVMRHVADMLSPDFVTTEAETLEDAMRNLREVMPPTRTLGCVAMHTEQGCDMVVWTAATYLEYARRARVFPYR